MLSKHEQHTLRSRLFKHLDGIAIAPTAYVLHQKGVLDYLLKNKKASLAELTNKFKANEGYLNVALRLLCSQGWLIQESDNAKEELNYCLSSKSTFAFQYTHLYKEVVDLLKLGAKFHPRRFDREPFQVLDSIFQKFRKNFDMERSQNPIERDVQEQILVHIEGVLIRPTIVHLGMGGMFHKYFMEASFKPEEFHKDPESFRKILDMFTYLDWFKEKKGTYQFTDIGLFYAKRASAYGVTVSYIPTFRSLEELIFGNPRVLKNTNPDETEKHVDRAMNVWGSGGAHTGYFKVVDEIIIEMFNKPIHEQPKGILDMGCGNGAFLQHLFDVIAKQTLRGQLLEEHPLILVGVDYNEEALKITKANLIQADIWAKVIWGDIGRPDLLAADLSENYGIELSTLLNVRTFLDHNRVWESPKMDTSNRSSNSTGAFAFEGERISNHLVEASLLEHIQKWSSYVSQFGLLIIELHTVPSHLVAENLGKTAATAYDATHGYSDQYIVEVDVFHKVMAEAGLFPDKAQFKKFPDNELATVTINLFKGKLGHEF